jgi:hypothetical protein
MADPKEETIFDAAAVIQENADQSKPDAKV